MDVHYDNETLRDKIAFWEIFSWNINFFLESVSIIIENFLCISHPSVLIAMDIFTFQSQLDGFQDVLQEKSIKIEEFVSEIEALFNSLEVRAI